MSKTHARQRSPRSTDTRRGAGSPSADSARVGPPIESLGSVDKLKAERIGSDAERQADSTTVDATGGCSRLSTASRTGHTKVGEVETAQLALELQRLPGWQEGERGLQKQYRFPDFTAACAFANAIAAVARKLRHPPRLSIDGPSLRVEVASPAVRRGVTGLDLDLAAGLEGVDRSLALPEAL